MKDRIETWKRAFEEDDQGVLPILIDFSWNYATYTTIAKIVGHSPETEDGRKNLNYMVLNLLASGYWQSATLAIRRLVDGGKLKGKKASILCEQSSMTLRTAEAASQEKYF